MKVKGDGWELKEISESLKCVRVKGSEWVLKEMVRVQLRVKGDEWRLKEIGRGEGDE